MIDFLQPALDMKIYSKAKWPQFLWVHPLTIGLLKPPVFLKTQGPEAIDKFIRHMDIFFTQYDIPGFDFRNITDKVHSYDGTHYGSGVNMMKGQIFLNYLASKI